MPSGWAASHLEQRLAKKYFVKNQGFLGALNTIRNKKYNFPTIFIPPNTFFALNNLKLCHSLCLFLYSSFHSGILSFEFSGAEHFTHIFICHKEGLKKCCDFNLESRILLQV